jgi:transposase-like protein
MNLKERLILIETTQTETEHSHKLLRLRCDSCQHQFSIDLGISLGRTKYLWAKLMREIMSHAYKHTLD